MDVRRFLRSRSNRNASPAGLTRRSRLTIRRAHPWASPKSCPPTPPVRGSGPPPRSLSRAGGRAATRAPSTRRLPLSPARRRAARRGDERRYPPHRHAPRPGHRPRGLQTLHAAAPAAAAAAARDAPTAYPDDIDPARASCDPRGPAALALEGPKSQYSLRPASTRRPAPPRRRGAHRRARRDGRVSPAGTRATPVRRGDARRRRCLSASRVPFPSVDARRTPLSLLAGDGARFSPCDASVGLARAGTARARDFALARIAIALWCATHRRCATFSDCCLCSRSARSSPGAVPPPEASDAPWRAATSGYV